MPLQQAFNHCKTVEKSLTSGAKTDPAIYAVYMALRKHRSSGQQTSPPSVNVRTSSWQSSDGSPEEQVAVTVAESSGSHVSTPASSSTAPLQSGSSGLQATTGRTGLQAMTPAQSASASSGAGDVFSLYGYTEAPPTFDVSSGSEMGTPDGRKSGWAQCSEPASASQQDADILVAEPDILVAEPAQTQQQQSQAQVQAEISQGQTGQAPQKNFRLRGKRPVHDSAVQESEFVDLHRNC